MRNLGSEPSSMIEPVTIGSFTVREEGPFFLIAGPCVIENEDLTLKTADFLKETSDSLGIPVIFKTSYDKANRTSLSSYRGPGIDEGLEPDCLFCPTFISCGKCQKPQRSWMCCRSRPSCAGRRISCWRRLARVFP